MRKGKRGGRGRIVYGKGVCCPSTKKHVKSATDTVHDTDFTVNEELLLYS